MFNFMMIDPLDQSIRKDRQLDRGVSITFSISLMIGLRPLDLIVNMIIDLIDLIDDLH